MHFDPIAAVEATYAPGTRAEWIQGVLSALSPLDGGFGFLAYSVDLRPGRPSHAIEGTHGVHDAWFQEAMGATARESPEVLRVLYERHAPVDRVSRRLRRIGSGAEALFRSEIARFGVEDILAVSAPQHDDVSLFVTIPLRRSDAIAPRTVAHLRAFAAHLGSALRLRRTGGVDDEPEAILDHRGHVLHAEGVGEPGRIRLAEAVRRVERARGGMRRASPEEALELWQGLVDGRWSIVDRVEADGRRIVLARRNPPDARDPRALTARERDVLAYVVRGHSNKYVGYLLGLGPSTVATHLASSLRKLGVATRADAIALLAGSRAGERG